MGEWQSGQLRRTVNPLPSGFVGSNPTSPTTIKRLIMKEQVKIYIDLIKEILQKEYGYSKKEINKLIKNSHMYNIMMFDPIIALHDSPENWIKDLLDFYKNK